MTRPGQSAPVRRRRLARRCLGIGVALLGAVALGGALLTGLDLRQLAPDSDGLASPEPPPAGAPGASSAHAPTAPKLDAEVAAPKSAARIEAVPSPSDQATPPASDAASKSPRAAAELAGLRPQAAQPEAGPPPLAAPEPGETQAVQKLGEPERAVAPSLPAEPSIAAGAADPVRTGSAQADQQVAQTPAPAMEENGRTAIEAALRGAAPSIDMMAATPDRPAASDETATAWARAYARGHEAQADGDIAAAVDWYRRAAELNPEHAAIVYDLGYALQLQGADYEAMGQYRRAIELNPRHAYAYYNLGFILQTKGYQEKAIDNYQMAASITPDNPYIYYNLARIMEERADLARAQTLYEKVIALDPEHRPGIDARAHLAALGLDRSTPPAAFK
jgi:tetratricopeptide (TPR) repeat protein